MHRSGSVGFRGGNVPPLSSFWGSIASEQQECDACLLGKSPKHKVSSSLPTAGVQETMELPTFCGRQTWALNHVNNLPESSRRHPKVLGAAAVGWGGGTTVSKEFEIPSSLFTSMTASLELDLI